MWLVVFARILYFNITAMRYDRVVAANEVRDI
jgi:hypothetical protein